jgi:guanine deaminase
MKRASKTNLLTRHSVQAHCTFLSPSQISEVSTLGTAIAHCPLSNAYFSAKPFPLREALTAGVRVGLGTDIAGGYSADIMNAMRQTVVVARMREGERTIRGQESCQKNQADQRGEEGTSLAVDWRESLYLATRGGALALGLPAGSGSFTVGAPFDAQWSKFDLRLTKVIWGLHTEFRSPTTRLFQWCGGRQLRLHRS